jgi:protease-4
MNFIHESIFVSSLRAFSKTLFSIFGIAIGLTAVAMIASLLSSPYTEAQRPQLFICPDDNGETKLLPSAPVILKVSIEGIIGSKKLNTDTVTLALRKAVQMIPPEKIKGVLLTINSPGGTTIDSSGIYQAIMDFKQKHNVPVYTFADGLMASGGMYIACASDFIGASQESVIGSVGVRMGPLFNFKDLMNKIGVDSKTLTQGASKDSFNPFRPWGTNEGEDIKQLIEESYQTFVEIVTAARKNLSKDKLINEYGAKIFSAERAMKYGYIDAANFTYSKTIQQLKIAANLDEKTACQVIEVLPYRSPVEDFVDSKLKFFSHSFKEQLTDFETKNPVCDRFFYLMDF